MEHEFRLKIIDSDEHALKSLGELLSNKTSLKIIKLLVKKEHYTNEISSNLGISVSLVIHHLKKIEDLGLLKITPRRLSKKGKFHRFFKMDPYIFVAPMNTAQEIINHGIERFYFF